MAFADYFEKNLQSAALLLQGIDAGAFRSALQAEVVAVAIDGEGIKSREGQATLDLAVRLIARLYPTIALVTLDASASKKLAPYKALARAINSKIELRDDLATATRCMVIGKSRPRLPARRRPFVVFAGSDNWVARISTRAPCSSGSSTNPFGAGVAACVAVANIFRASFKNALPLAKPDEEVRFCTLQMAPVTTGKPLNPRVRRFDMGEVFLAGAGAIGNGFLWAAARLDCDGKLVVVDHEKLASSNLQRYALTAEEEVGKQKVELAKAWLAKSKLKAEPQALTWEAFVASHADRKFERVAVAVDTARSRINVQASLPRHVHNGWTQAGEAGISRHGFAGTDACLACLYMPTKATPNHDQLIARALHLPETQDQLLDIRKRLQLGLPTDRVFLDKVVTAAGVPIQELLPFEGKPLQSLYVDGICGGAVMTLAQGGNTAQRNEVPMAFQSALAGILIAADLVAERLALRPRLPTKTQINLLTALAQFPSNGQRKAQPSKCFCEDPDFLNAYFAKYPAEAGGSGPPV